MHISGGFHAGRPLGRGTGCYRYRTSRRDRRMQPVRSEEPMATGGGISRREVRSILIGVLLTMFLAALDQTIVAPALTTIARDLGQFDAISWVVTAYLLSATA